MLSLLRRHRQRLTQIVLILIGLFALVFWLRSFDVREALEELVAANFWWVGAFMVSHAAMVTLRAARWRAILRPLFHLPFRPACEIFFLGEFLNITFAMRTGDVAKAAMLRQQTGVPVLSGLSLIFADKIFELWGLISVTALGLVMVLATNEDVGGISVPVLAFYPALLVFMVAFLRLMATNRTEVIVQRLAERTGLIGRLAGLTHHIVIGLRAAAQMPRSRLVGLALISSFIYAVDGLSVTFLFWAVGADVSPFKVLLASTMVALIFLIPVPGNIGTLEGGFSIFFGQLGVAGSSQINAVAILFHVALYLGMLLLALGSLHRYRSLVGARPDLAVAEIADSDGSVARGDGAQPDEPPPQMEADPRTPLRTRDSELGTRR
ncbi:MAG TPA: lysylphosphatidylglycerol synthase transmembrane domain-containing protein [Dehalococcoidia bacterium]|nr:lysylphosphatidylglycerol synthase transmembrane domain-containing protein [Dehalococcoidia bacterium]